MKPQPEPKIPEICPRCNKRLDPKGELCPQNDCVYRIYVSNYDGDGDEYYDDSDSPLRIFEGGKGERAEPNHAFEEGTEEGGDGDGDGAEAGDTGEGDDGGSEGDDSVLSGVGEDLAEAAAEGAANAGCGCFGVLWKVFIFPFKAIFGIIGFFADD